MAGTSTSGTFDGVPVHVGVGGGLADVSGIGGESTYFHAARFPDVGDVVLAVTRRLDVEQAATTAIELRAFTATAPGRGLLATAPRTELLQAPGAIAYAELALAVAGEGADVRGAATLVHCNVTDGVPTAEAARRVADLLLGTWESELRFGSWPALRGTLDAFAETTGGAPAGWAFDWLRAQGYRVDGGERFLKVLVPAWLDPAAAAPADAASFPPEGGDDEDLDG